MTPIYREERQQAIGDLRAVSPTPSHSGINMLVRGRVRGFSFHGPKDVGEYYQRKLDDRLAEIADEIMGEILQDPSLRDIRMEP